MVTSGLESTVEKVEQPLFDEKLFEKTDLVIRHLLKVEALCAGKKSLADEVKRLRQQLARKKQEKTRT